MCKMVGGKLDLITILARLGRQRHDSRVADEHIEAIVGKLLHSGLGGGKRGKVALKKG